MNLKSLPSVADLPDIEVRACLAAACAVLAATHAGNPSGKTFRGACAIGISLCESEAEFMHFFRKAKSELVRVSVELGKEAIREVFARSPKG